MSHLAESRLIGRAQSPAKLNLTLRVGGVRPDGFHEIESLIVPIDLTDTVAIEQTPAGGIACLCDDPTIPTDGRNLAVRAADAFFVAAKIPTRSIRIQLEKRIPAGAGLGGGSSNAATTLMLLNRHHAFPLDQHAMHAVAASIGSDVPFFLAAGPGIIRGRGEIVTPLELRISAFVVLVLPPFACSTAAVYRAFDDDERPSQRLSASYFAPSVTTAEALMQLASNDLERAAFAVEPRLARLFRDLLAAGEGPIRMTGSGSTLYALHADPASAAAQAQRIAAAFAIRTRSTRLISSTNLQSPP